MDADGSYQETVYNNALNNTLKISGKWYLNSDQTKLGYKFEEINGYKLPVSSDTARHFNTIILKLTTDTLIYGNEAYYGNNKVYGHDDWYFVREK
jgi:hypothetical protein